MKNALRLMMGAMIAVSFVACGDPTKADKELKQLREKMAADEKQRQADLDDQIKRTNDVLDRTFEQFNKGGQPPRIRLEGAMMVKGKLHPQIDVKVMAGFNKNGEPTAIDPSRANYGGNEVFDDSVIKNMVDKGTYVNMGCDLSGRKDIENLTEVEISQTVLEPIQATVAFICRGNIANDLKLAVGKAIFNEANVNITSATIFGVDIKAHEVVLIGSNHILAKADSVGFGETIVSLTIGANKISGDGTLEIKAAGADQAPHKIVTEK